MKTFVTRSVGALIVSATVALGMMGGAQAQSAEGVTSPTKTMTKAKKKTAKARQGNKVKFMRGSEESTAERNARLKRECRGRVNAGACEGYTR